MANQLSANNNGLNNKSNDNFIKTSAHNYVSRTSSVHGARNVEMKGKSVILSDAVVRGDFGPVRIGRYTTIGSGTIMRPPSVPNATGGSRNSSGGSSLARAAATATVGIKFVPLLVGSHCSIGSKSVVESAYIGSSVRIGSNCVLGKRSIIKDCCYIESGTVIPPDTVIPPFSIVAGMPGRIVGELPESAATELVTLAIRSYNQFVDDLATSET